MAELFSKLQMNFELSDFFPKQEKDKKGEHNEKDSR